MIHSQQEPCGSRQYILRQGRYPLLQRHPVLFPVALVSSSFLLVFLSFFADSLFPVLVLFGVPSALVCLLLAFVLGTCGILAAIVHIIEHVEHYWEQAVIFPKSKERGYDRT